MGSSTFSGFILGVVIALVLGYYAIYVPQRAQVERLQGQMAQARMHQQTQADVAALLGQLARSQAKLPQEPDISWLSRELVARAQDAGVQVTTITQDLPQAVGPFTRLTVSLKLSATYHQLGRFLDDLERSDRFIRVDRIDLNSRPDAHEIPSIRVAFSTLSVPPLVSSPAKPAPVR